MCKNNMMRRNYLTVLCLCLAILLTSCGKSAFVHNEATAVAVTIAPTAATEQKKYDSSVSDLKIMQDNGMYSFADMNNDILLLQKEHADKVKVLGAYTTYDKRMVYDIVLGDLRSENQILVMGATHAREYITTQLVMHSICDIISASDKSEYKGKSMDDLLDNVAIHFIPMVNPDGVTIAQYGVDGLNTEQAKNTVKQICSEFNFNDTTQWKANAEGTDINRNFDAGWNEYNDNVGKPAPDHYKGTQPGSSAEAKGLIELTKKYKFKRTISYHTKGSLIYWNYKQTGALKDESEKFADEIAQVTGYAKENDSDAVDACGYKDWAVSAEKIPSITIEVGGKSDRNPVPESYLPEILAENKEVLPATLYNLKYK